MAVNGKCLQGAAVLAMFMILALAGCGNTEPVTIRNEKAGVQFTGREQNLPDQGRPFNIPLEYMPPPGKCRIWFPGRPPERQPPSGECADLERHLPLNTWLLRGAEE